MQLLVSFFICAVLAVNIHGTKQNLSQQTCTVGSVCGVLENVLRKQSHLEKKVKEHDRILGNTDCKGKIQIFVACSNFALHKMYSPWYCPKSVILRTL